MTLRLPRRQYADLYGPTVGDRVRLADTDILIEVEKDFTVYGDEVKFGGGKTIRDGMGQGQAVNGPGPADAKKSRSFDRRLEQSRVQSSSLRRQSAEARLIPKARQVRA